MKIFKRLTLGILFPFIFIGTMFIICPISWVVTGDYNSPLYFVIEFFNNL